MCPGYDQIIKKNVLVLEDDSSAYVKKKIRKKEKWTITDNYSEKAKNSNCVFICITDKNVPKKIYKIADKGINEHWVLVDEFSGYLLKSQTTNLVGTVTTVSKLVDSLLTHLILISWK